MYTIINVIQLFSHSIAHTAHLHIHMAHFPLLYYPLLAPLCSPFVSLPTYLAPSSCDRNRPPQSQVACKLTPFAPPFTQPTPSLQIPRTPTTQRLTKTTSGIFRLLLTGTVTSSFPIGLIRNDVFNFLRNTIITPRRSMPIAIVI